VARAFVAAAGQPHTFGKSYHTPGEEWMTWDVYHQRVAEALGAPKPTLVHIPTDLLARLAPKRAGIIAENFQFSNIFDAAAARADLGFQYTIPWVEGVRRMAAWLDAHGRIESSDADPFEDRLIDTWRRLGARLGEELGVPA
jgi:nucleoside-diphosphate-sugar epimerase